MNIYQLYFGMQIKYISTNNRLYISSIYILIYKIHIRKIYIYNKNS